MTAPNLDFGPAASTTPRSADPLLPLPDSDDWRPNTPGLCGHVRQLQKKNQVISRWLIFAFLGGAIVALAMVQFAIP
jgi:hypothetical protein